MRNRLSHRSDFDSLAGNSIQAALLETLAISSATQNELAEVLETSVGNVGRALRTLDRAGWAFIEGYAPHWTGGPHGAQIYALTGKGRKELERRVMTLAKHPVLSPEQARRLDPFTAHGTPRRQTPQRSLDRSIRYLEGRSRATIAKRIGAPLDRLYRAMDRLGIPKERTRRRSA